MELNFWRIHTLQCRCQEIPQTLLLDFLLLILNGNLSEMIYWSVKGLLWWSLKRELPNGYIYHIPEILFHILIDISY